jgi:hypothetical protein
MEDEGAAMEGEARGWWRRVRRLHGARDRGGVGCGWRQRRESLLGEGAPSSSARKDERTKNELFLCKEWHWWVIMLQLCEEVQNLDFGSTS